jgi:hypothetical protein
MSGKDPTELDTFADSNLGKFTLDYDSTKTTFDLKISELDGSVCSQLKKGGMVQNVDCNPDAKTATLTYYKNLATNDEEGKKSPTGGSGSTKGNPGPAGDEDGAECSGDRPGECSVCLSTGESSAHWFDSDALCTTAGQTCMDGNCVTTAADEPALGNMCKCIYNEDESEYLCGGDLDLWISCSRDADCKKFGTWDDTQGKCVASFCTNNGDCTSDEYCHYTSMDDDTCKPNQKGICMKKADAKGDFASGTTAEADGFIRSSGEMDWFSAQNFCRSYGKNLVTLSQMGLGNVVPSGNSSCSGTGSKACQNIDATGWSAIRAKFGDDFLPWTANLISSNSCLAFYVGLYGSTAGVYDDSRNFNVSYALCK